MTSPFQDGAVSGGLPSGGVAGPYDEMSRILAGLPRPRSVRMSRRGKLIATMVSFALLASLAAYAVTGMALQRTAGAQYAGPSQVPVYALSIVFIVVFGAVMLNVIGRQKRLLAEGEMTVARVIKRTMARNGPFVYYQFITPAGQQISRGASDGSRQLAVGMSVPIFYDAHDPKKQIALCASFYEVVQPGQE